MGVYNWTYGGGENFSHLKREKPRNEEVSDNKWQGKKWTAWNERENISGNVVKSGPEGITYNAHTREREREWKAKRELREKCSPKTFLVNYKCKLYK